MVKVKSSYTDVRIGTKKWRILARLLCHKGLTTREAVWLGLCVGSGDFSYVRVSLRDMNGYEVLTFKAPAYGGVGLYTWARSPGEWIYRITGRVCWSGPPIDFLDAAQKPDFEAISRATGIDIAYLQKMDAS